MSVPANNLAGGHTGRYNLRNNSRTSSFLHNNMQQQQQQAAPSHDYGLPHLMTMGCLLRFSLRSGNSFEILMLI